MPDKVPAERDQPSLAHPAESVQIGTIEFSVERDQIAPAMLAVQKVVQTIPYDSTAVVKHKDGSSHSFRYTSLRGMLDAVLPAMHENDLVLVQGAGGGGTAVGVTTCAMHVSGQWAQTTIPFATNGAAMAVGSVVSYGRRYGIPALFGIPCEEDDGGMAAQRSMEPEESLPEKFTNDMLFALPKGHQKIIKLLGWTVGKTKPLLAKFVDDTGTVDRAAVLAYLNRQLERQDEEAGR